MIPIGKMRKMIRPADASTGTYWNGVRPSANAATGAAGTISNTMFRGVFGVPVGVRYLRRSKVRRRSAKPAVRGFDSHLRLRKDS